MYKDWQQSEFKGGRVRIGHLQTVFEQEGGKRVDWVLRTITQQFNDAFREDWDQVDIKVFPESEGCLVENLPLLILLIFLLHFIVLLLNFPDDLFLLIHVRPGSSLSFLLGLDSLLNNCPF